jgi:hypothetical protein
LFHTGKKESTSYPTPKKLLAFKNRLNWRAIGLSRIYFPDFKQTEIRKLII